MDDIFYDIGLSFTSNRNEPKKRSLYYNPFVIFVYLLLFWMIKLSTLVIGDDDQLLVMIGDQGHLLEIGRAHV